MNRLIKDYTLDLKEDIYTKEEKVKSILKKDYTKEEFLLKKLYYIKYLY